MFLQGQKVGKYEILRSLGSGGFDVADWKRRPYRAPHHTASAVGLVGGGRKSTKFCISNPGLRQRPDLIEALAPHLLREAGLEPLTLEAKEGLALLNGTQMMSAIGALLAADAVEQQVHGA